MPAAGRELIAFLFADIEGSTALLERLGDEYAGLLAGYREVLVGAIGDAGGWTIDTQGDGHFAGFATASGAVGAAAAIQRRLSDRQWPGDVAVRARLGLHVGEVLRTDTGPVGIEVHRAARIAAAGHGGQVLLSQAIHDLVADALGPDLGVHDLGLHRFKDLTRPERVYQLDITGLPAEFPPIRSLDRRPHNLPVQLTSFVGREAELAELDRLLRENRLVTLIGSGGAGKTRISLQAGAAAVDGLEDGVWLAELAPLSDPALVPAVVARALGVREQRATPILDDLESHLRGRQVLLILDNCEHVIDAAAELAGWLLATCPGTRILATSREVLGLPGEATYRLPSLTLPDAAAASRDDVLAAGAVELFTDRAAAVRRGFELTAQNVAAVVEICRHVEGIPLAVELAAARLNVLSVQQVAERLDDQFRVLAATDRGTPSRHRTLRATMDWSFDLLDPTTRIAFRRLGVFRGSFSLAAAEEVCESADMAAVELLPQIARLVDSSLLLVDDGPEVRYRMLVPVRAYAWDRLAEAGEQQAQQQRHASYYRGLVRGGGSGLVPREQAEWLAALELDHDNLRAALRWTVDNGELDLAVGLAGSLARFWVRHGHFAEARRWFGDVLAMGEPEPSIELAAILRIGAGLAFVKGDREEAEALATREAEVATTLGDPVAIARSFNLRAGLAWRQTDFARAADRYERALEVIRPTGDPFVTNLLTNNALLLVSIGRLDEAAERADELVRWSEEPGKEGSVPDVGLVLGTIEFARDDLDAAQEHFEQAITEYRELGLTAALAKGLQELANLRRLRGDLEGAAVLAAESTDLYVEMEDRANEAVSRLVMGRAALGSDDIEAARQHVRAGMAIACAEHRPEEVLQGMLCLAALAAAGEPALAVRVYAAAEEMRAAMGRVFNPAEDREFERQRAELRQRLGSAAYRNAAEEVPRLGPEEAARLVLGT